MALTRMMFDKHGIPRKDFADLFHVDEEFYIAVMPTTNRLHLRSAPFARSSLFLKGPKYTRSMHIAREALYKLKGFPQVRIYTAYSPDDPSYFVSGFETFVNTEEDMSLAEPKFLLLVEAWNKTLAQMKSENIEVWSKK